MYMYANRELGTGLLSHSAVDIIMNIDYNQTVDTVFCIASFLCMDLIYA